MEETLEETFEDPPPRLEDPPAPGALLVLSLFSFMPVICMLMDESPWPGREYLLSLSRNEKLTFWTCA